MQIKRKETKYFLTYLTDIFNDKKSSTMFLLNQKELKQAAIF